MDLVQPPSGGCVLKHLNLPYLLNTLQAAAFGRLCVETSSQNKVKEILEAAAFGRLCVETLSKRGVGKRNKCSRLRAAVC